MGSFIVDVGKTVCTACAYSTSRSCLDEMSGFESIRSGVVRSPIWPLNFHDFWRSLPIVWKRFWLL